LDSSASKNKDKLRNTEKNEDIISKKYSLSEDAYRTLKNAIVNFELRPGDRYTQPQLESKYGLTTASLRNALTRLQQEQLIIAVPRQGYAISSITIEDIINIFDLRMLIEPYSVKIASEKINRAKIDTLKMLIKLQSNTNYRESTREFLMIDRDFHLTIAKMTENSILISFSEKLFDLSLRALYLGVFLTKKSAMAWTNIHEEVVKELEAGNTDEASKAIFRGLEKSKDRLIKAMLKNPVLSKVNLVFSESE